ncbi:hypothetical protein M409DRAFT_17534 [Zasmidium cellare ATCC 36951]|uniref:Uncharacterized protein n=1 Tax=Zasmidium cellare ATCC 36951 TaxID=1080233 RepID=A0A6A6D2G5_ZASCE|nr:uncharacterized protein M409DRAFT_17534 [Zasmidium cellare ATCC 36951]KAF2172299.1 hypothetical protein M409DRAFT_17534 [Zasmidium cellare ATCC 36951]
MRKASDYAVLLLYNLRVSLLTRTLGGDLRRRRPQRVLLCSTTTSTCGIESIPSSIATTLSSTKPSTRPSFLFFPYSTSRLQDKMSKSTGSYKGHKELTRDEFNESRRKHVYPKESEVTGGPLNFIKVHSPEPRQPRGRLLRDWTRCESKGKGGCKSGHLGFFVELEDGVIKHAMMMLSEECGEDGQEDEEREEEVNGQDESEGGGDGAPVTRKSARVAQKGHEDSGRKTSRQTNRESSPRSWSISSHGKGQQSLTSGAALKDT